METQTGAEAGERDMDWLLAEYDRNSSDSQNLNDELKRLQASLPADKPEAIRETIEQELNRPVDEVFGRFDEVPERGNAGDAQGEMRLLQPVGGREDVIRQSRGGIQK